MINIAIKNEKKDDAILVAEEFTSLKMAEITGKRHANVIRDINDELEKLQLPDTQRELIFELSSYTTKQGKDKRLYLMSKDGWLQIGARYDAKTRYAIISYTNKLEKENKELKKSINDILIERLDNGERKIIKNYIRNTIKASGYTGLKAAVKELNKATTGKDYKEWLLTQLGITFDTFINEMPVKKYKDISIEADKVEMELKHMLKNFLSFSRGQVTRSLNKEYKKLRIAKDAITNAYLDMRPKKFSGTVEVGDDEAQRYYYIDDEEITAAISPSEFEKDGKTVRYMSGIVNIKKESLFINVTGGEEGLIFQNKVRDLDKVKYSIILSVRLDDFSYEALLIRIG